MRKNNIIHVEYSLEFWRTMMDQFKINHSTTLFFKLTEIEIEPLALSTCICVCIDETIFHVFVVDNNHVLLRLFMKHVFKTSLIWKWQRESSFGINDTYAHIFNIWNSCCFPIHITFFWKHFSQHSQQHAHTHTKYFLYVLIYP